MCVFMYYGACIEVREHFQESILSFHHVSDGDRTQVINLSSKHLYLLSHLACPVLSSLNDHQGNCLQEYPSYIKVMRYLMAVTVSAVCVYSKFTLLIVKSFCFVCVSVEREN